MHVEKGGGTGTDLANGGVADSCARPGASVSVRMRAHAGRPMSRKPPVHRVTYSAALLIGPVPTPHSLHVTSSLDHSPQQTSLASGSFASFEAQQTFLTPTPPSPGQLYSLVYTRNQPGGPLVCRATPRGRNKHLSRLTRGDELAFEGRRRPSDALEAPPSRPGPARPKILIEMGAWNVS